MVIQVVKFIVEPSNGFHGSSSLLRKISTAQYVASRARDPTFEKLMDHYKNLVKVVAIQDLILANPNRNPPSISVDFLSKLSQKLHLNRGAPSFLRRYPHIFEIFYNIEKSMPFCKLTDKTVEISQIEADAIQDSMPLVVDRLVRILSMSITKSVPLRAIFKVWRELGLPNDFEESVILRNPQLFMLFDGNEPNTHVLKLVPTYPSGHFTAGVENWRVLECCKEDSKLDRTEIRYSFMHGFPPGMRLRKSFKAKVKDWQKLPYIGPYEEMGEKKRSKSGMKGLEKRAVGIIHEFMSLTVEKMVEVEKISHFRKCFGIDFNIRDLFLDHPGMFYLSTKGKRHTVFLREAYERGRLIDPNPVYEARMKLLHLVMMGRRGLLIKSSRAVVGLLLLEHMLLGGLPLVALSMLNDDPAFHGGLRDLSMTDVSALLYTSIFGSAISYGVFFFNATRGSLTKLSSLTFLTPMFASIFGFLYLGESFSELQLVGAFITLVAIYMVNYRTSTEE